MRKYIIGFVAGLLFASAIPVYGAVSSVVGKKVSGELTVKLNQKEIGKAIVVEGKSYLPVRATSDALGLKLNVSQKEVNLVDGQIDQEFLKKELEIKKTGRYGYIQFRDQEEARKKEVEEYIEGQKKQLQIAEEALAMIAEGDPLYTGQKDRVDSLKREITTSEESLKDIQLTIDDYNQKISERDIEIADLESKLQGRQ